MQRLRHVALLVLTLVCLAGCQHKVVTPGSNLPTRFTDNAPQFKRGQNSLGEYELIPIDPVPFDMILVPGDEAKDIAPFYLGETEVTWGMIETWMYCRDILDIREVERLIQAGLRPSWPDGWVILELRGDEPNCPVITATRLACEAYCIWLSEKTGRHYRLPTPDEWALALAQGGGCPGDSEILLAIGRFKENSPDQTDELFPHDPFDPFQDKSFLITTPVKSRPPNTLGIYDLLGNAAEWVVAPDGSAYLMGGHYAVPVADMSADWTDEENHAIWNATYPQLPYSRFWYWGEHHFQGFRLVCEVEPTP